ncbi:MAG: secretin N-terminal domain-containing protein [Clostridia bacterium]
MKALLVLALALAAGAAAAQSLEIIPLRHATVEQVLPVLRPLLEPGATLSGQSGQLFVRTSPENLAELRRALEAIDHAPRRLLISVRFDEDAQEARQAIGASGTVGNRRTDIDVRAQASERRVEERIDQRVQVLEGGRATIAAGRSRTLPQRQYIRTPTGVISQETFVVQEAATGFDVVPRLAGEWVTLDIAPQRERLSGAGTVESQRVATAASGRLGEWFELGGISTAGARDERGLASSSLGSGADSRRVWVKVEELP